MFFYRYYILFGMPTSFGFFLSPSVHKKRRKYLKHPQKWIELFCKNCQKSRMQYFSKQKNWPPRTLSSSCKKSFSSIECTMSEKWGRFCTKLWKKKKHFAVLVQKTLHLLGFFKLWSCVWILKMCPTDRGHLEAHIEPKKQKRKN
jgi:hypothetical protein